MPDLKHRDILLEDACATSSPDYCKKAVVFNARQRRGFSTTTKQFAAARATD